MPKSSTSELLWLQRQRYICRNRPAGNNQTSFEVDLDAYEIFRLKKLQQEKLRVEQSNQPEGNKTQPKEKMVRIQLAKLLRTNNLKSWIMNTSN